MVRTVESNSSCIVLEYFIPEIRQQALNRFQYRGEQATQLSAGNCLLWDNPGEPLVPYIPVRVVIPAEYDLASVTATGQTQALNGKYLLAWGDGLVGFDPSCGQGPDRKVYATDKTYPALIYDLVGVQCKNGVNIAIVNLFPLQYNPVTETVYQTRAIRLTLSLAKNGYFRGRDIRVDLDALDPAVFGLENTSALSTYSSRSGVLPVPGGLCTGREEYSFVIITSNNLKSGSGTSYFNDLIAQRKSMGFTANLVTVEEIYAKYKGVDVPEEPKDKIRSFIRDAYNSWKTKQVLLAGNSTVIPSGKTYITAGYTSDWGGTMYLNDLYYQCVDGFYNFDKTDSLANKNWGEFNITHRDGDNYTMPDALSELSVGRWLVSTPQEVSNMVYKTLAYEKSTSPAIKKVLMVAEWLFKKTNAPSPEMCNGTACMEQVKNGTALYKGLSSIPGVAFDKLYDSDYNFPTDSIIWGFTIDELVAKLNANNVTVINGLGHGSFDRLMKTSHLDIPSKLTNTLPMFMVTQACYAAAGDNDVMSYYFTEKSRNGLWGGVFNTFLGYSPHPNYPDEINTLLGPSQRIHLEFWNAYTSKNKRMPGDMLSLAHDNQINLMKDGRLIRYICHITRLQGDPAVVIKLADGVTEQTIPVQYPKPAASMNIITITPHRIMLFIPNAGRYTIGLYTPGGKCVYSLKDRLLQQGYQSLSWNPGKFASGVYVVKIHDRFSSLKKRFTNAGG